MIKEIVVYSSFILLQMVATQLNSCVDSILLGMIVPSSAILIAIYSIGQQITQYFQSIGSAVTGVLMPGIVRLVENGASAEDLCSEMVRIGRFILIILGLIAVNFTVFGKQFIELWVGESKLEAYSIALIFIWVYGAILTQSVGSQILWAKNEHKEQSVIKMIIVIINIFLTVILIKWKPLIGATIGTAISLFLGDVVLTNWVFVKKIRIDIREYYLRLFKGLLPSLWITLIAGFAMRLLGLSGWIGFFINNFVMVCIYLLCMICFGMNAYEKKLLLAIINKIFRIKTKRIQ